MIIEMNNPDLASFEESEDLKVVVAYEDWSAAMCAKTLLNKIGRQCGDCGRLVYSMWKFQVLSEPILLNMAATEAKAADIIIISASNGQQLPTAVRRWMNRCFATRKKHHSALVALVRTNKQNPTLPQAIRPCLEQMAKAAGMDFFWQNSPDAEFHDLSSTAPRYPVFQTRAQAMIY